MKRIKNLLAYFGGPRRDRASALATQRRLIVRAFLLLVMLLPAALVPGSAFVQSQHTDHADQGIDAKSDPGDLLWEAAVDASDFDQAYSVATLGNRVFVAGWVGVPPPDVRDFFVTAYNAKTGSMLWQDQVNKGPNDSAAGVVAAENRVFVSGWVGSNCCRDWFVRAYDAESGNFLWEDQFDLGGTSDLPRVDGLAVWNGMLFVVGMGDDSFRWVVRAYDSATGTLRWQDQVSDYFTRAESVVVTQGSVFVGGICSTAVSGGICVRSYDAWTGALLWQQRISGPFSFITALKGLGTDGKRIFFGGSLPNTSGKPNLIVGAYDARTGTPLWQDQVDKGGEYDAAERIAVSGNQVFATGAGGPRCLLDASPPSDCAALIRSYNAITGRLLWQKELNFTEFDDQAEASLATKRTLYVASFVNFAFDGERGDWLVQAYDASTGELLWEDLRDAGGGAEVPLDLAFHNNRLFAVGRSVDANNNWNFAVRAYDGRTPKDEDDGDDDN